MLNCALERSSAFGVGGGLCAWRRQRPREGTQVAPVRGGACHAVEMERRDCWRCPGVCVGHGRGVG